MLYIELVRAWVSSDGTLFPYEDMKRALRHEKKEQTQADRRKLVEEKQDEMLDYYCKMMEEEGIEVVRKNVSGPNIEEHGWECNHKDNPLDVCVYVYDSDNYWVEGCIFCGEPEERK